MQLSKEKASKQQCNSQTHNSPTILFPKISRILKHAILKIINKVSKCNFQKSQTINLRIIKGSQLAILKIIQTTQEHNSRFDLLFLQREALKARLVRNTLPHQELLEFMLAATSTQVCRRQVGGGLAASL